MEQQQTQNTIASRATGEAFLLPQQHSFKARCNVHGLKVACRVDEGMVHRCCPHTSSPATHPEENVGFGYPT